MEGAHLKTAGACFIAKSSPKAPPGLSGADPGVQRGRLAQNGHRWHLLCARPWGCDFASFLRSRQSRCGCPRFLGEEAGTLPLRVETPRVRAQVPAPVPARATMTRSVGCLPAAQERRTPYPSETAWAPHSTAHGKGRDGGQSPVEMERARGMKRHR